MSLLDLFTKSKHFQLIRYNQSQSVTSSDVILPQLILNVILKCLTEPIGNRKKNYPGDTNIDYDIIISCRMFPIITSTKLYQPILYLNSSISSILYEFQMTSCCSVLHTTENATWLTMNYLNIKLEVENKNRSTYFTISWSDFGQRITL